MTVSEPNHVANNPDVTTYTGIRRPAIAKSLEVFTNFEAYHPTKIVIKRYRTIKVINIFWQNL